MHAPFHSKFHQAVSKYNSSYYVGSILYAPKTHFSVLMKRNQPQN